MKRTILAAAAVALAATAATAQTKHDMKCGFVTVNDSQHRSAEIFKDKIAGKTGGAVDVRIFPLAQLGTIPRQVEGIQLGTQECFISPPGFFVGLNQAFQAPDAPALFESQMHQHRSLNHPTVRDKFLALASHAGIVGNYTWSAGATAVASRRPIETLDDFKGRKIRVLATKMEIATLKTVGAAGIPMPYSEVLPALQRKGIDGVRSGIIVMGPSKFYTVAKYIYNEKSAFIPSGMWLNRKWLDSLPKAHRAAIFEVGKEMGDITVKIAIEITAKWEKLWGEKGGTVTEPTAADRAELFRRVRPLGDEFLGKNPKIAPMYKLIKAAAAATAGK